MLDFMFPQMNKSSDYSFKLGTVTSLDPFRVKLDGQETAPDYTPARLAGGGEFEVNDRVILLVMRGSYVVLGKLGGEANTGLPRGSIIMWHGSEIPTGFAICDGTNGTPDLRDRFILGAADGEEVGDTGGSNSVTLTTDNMPSHGHDLSIDSRSLSHSHTASCGNQSASHTHTASTSTTGTHNHNGRYKLLKVGTGTGYNVLRRISSEDSYDGTDRITSTTGGHSHSISIGNQSASHNHTVTIASTSQSHSHTGTAVSNGGGESFDNRPAFYKLLFIMKL
jgi:hypothetical protein